MNARGRRIARAQGAPALAGDEPEPEPETEKMTPRTFERSENPLVQKLEEIKPDEITPRQAMDLMYELTQLFRMLKG